MDPETFVGSDVLLGTLLMNSGQLYRLAGSLTKLYRGGHTSTTIALLDFIG